MRANALLARVAHAVDRNDTIRRAIRRAVSWETRHRIAVAIGADKPQDIDLSNVDLIRERDPDWLADPERVEHELLPALGLCNDPRVYPASFRRYRGRGLKHWQAPNQFSLYLAQLAQYPIRSYLELGVWHGGTFVITVEYLSRFNALTSATGMDIAESRGVQRFAELRPEVDFLQIDTTSQEFPGEIERRGPFDLVLVDADHLYEPCRNDVTVVRPHANMIALHDIVDETCEGVQQVWQEMKFEGAGEWDFFEFTDQYDEVLQKRGAPVFGLGLAVRKAFLPRQPSPH